MRLQLQVRRWKMRKKLLQLLVLTLFFAFSIGQAFCAEYTDLAKTHWAYPQITDLTAENIVVGYPDSTFHPDENVTRAEFATMVIKAVGQQNAELKETINFNDVPKDFWAYNMIERAVRFDIIKQSSDNNFNPQSSVTRAQALTFVVNALETKNITDAQAKTALAKAYDDYKTVPPSVAIIAGKGEILGVIPKVPGKERLLDAERPATRAELAVLLYNLKEQVKINANAKLKEAMKPRTADGIVIEEATSTGNIGVIPAGTVLPVVMCSNVSSQKTKLGAVFTAKTPKNFVTKEKYLLIVENSPITGQAIDVKVGRYFWRNGKLILETKSIKVNDKQVAKFCALANTEKKPKGFWQKLFRTIFKGSKVVIKNGQVIDIKLLQPVTIDLSNGNIIE